MVDGIPITKSAHGVPACLLSELLVQSAGPSEVDASGDPSHTSVTIVGTLEKVRRPGWRSFATFVRNRQMGAPHAQTRPAGGAPGRGTPPERSIRHQVRQEKRERGEGDQQPEGHRSEESRGGKERAGKGKSGVGPWNEKK